MKISVAMCTWNGERYLSEQLRSIAAQSLRPAELVVCDDSSSDQTLDILHQFRDSAPFPVRITQNIHNLGSTQNFAKCVALCDGDAIALCDQDDRWRPEKLAVCAAALDADSSLGGVFSNADLMDDFSTQLPGSLWERISFDKNVQRDFANNPARSLTRADLVTGAAMVFRANERKRLLPIPSEWIHDGWIAFLIATLARLQPLPAMLFTYRLHRNQQIGLEADIWHQHLSTPADAALEAHLRRARMYGQLDERLQLLSCIGESNLPEASFWLQRRVRYEAARANLLEISRVERVVPALLLLRDYMEYSKGFLSLLRDIVHSKPIKADLAK